VSQPAADGRLVMYANGDGVPQDYAEVAKWCRLAAEQGDAAGQNSLGFMYAKGNGVLQDTEQAYMWFNIAASQSSASREERDRAVQNRDVVITGMTPAQIGEAQRLSRECLRQNFKGCDPQAASQERVASLPATPPKSLPTRPSVSAPRKIVPLENDGGTFVVPVAVNGVMTLKFVIDSGQHPLRCRLDIGENGNNPR
jgi:TPR repeat protein